jgi:hypothetical protein
MICGRITLGQFDTLRPCGIEAPSDLRVRFPWEMKGLTKREQITGMVVRRAHQLLWVYTLRGNT